MFKSADSYGGGSYDLGADRALIIWTLTRLNGQRNFCTLLGNKFGKSAQTDTNDQIMALSKNISFKYMAYFSHIFGV